MINTSSVTNYFICFLFSLIIFINIFNINYIFLLFVKKKILILFKICQARTFFNNNKADIKLLKTILLKYKLFYYFQLFENFIYFIFFLILQLDLYALYITFIIDKRKNLQKKSFKSFELKELVYFSFLNII